MLRLKDTGNDNSDVLKTENIVDVTETKKQLNNAYNLNMVTDVSNMAKKSTDGILFGALTGTVAAYFLRKPYYYGAIAGAVVGGVLGYASHQASCE